VDFLETETNMIDNWLILFDALDQKLSQIKQSKLTDTEQLTLKHCCFFLDKMFKIKPQVDSQVSSRKPQSVREELEQTKEMLEVQKFNASFLEKQNSQRLLTLQTQIKQAEKSINQLAQEKKNLEDQFEDFRKKNQKIESIKSTLKKKQKDKEFLQKIPRTFDDELHTAREQHRKTSNDLETAIEENCRLQQEIENLKTRLRQFAPLENLSNEEQIKFELVKLHKEYHNLLTEKSELLLENQALKTIVAEDKSKEGQEGQPEVFKCSVTHIMFDMLFSILVERRKFNEEGSSKKD